MKIIILILSLLSSGIALEAQDQPIIVPTDAYDRSVYQANAIDRISRDRSYEKTLMAEMIVRTYEQNPNADPRVLGPQLNELEERYKKQKQLAASTAGYEAISHDALYEAEMLFEIASELPYLKNVAGIAKKAFDEKVYNINQELAPEAQITAQAQQERMFSYVQATQQETWSKLTKLVSQNAYAASATDQVFATYFGARTTDKAFAIFRNNPQFQQSEVVKYLATVADRTGALTVDLMELKAAYQRDMKKLLGRAQQSQRMLEELQQQSNNRREAQRIKDQVEKNKQERDLELSAGRSALVIVTTFIPDKKLARDISISGNVVISVVDSIGKYNDLIALNRNNATVSGLSSVVLTGNLLTAFTTLMTVFNDPASSPDQIIIGQLREIQATLVKFRQDVQFRFDRVDITLNQIYDGLLKNLARIDFDIGRLDARVEDVQASLLQLSTQLDHIQQSMFEYLTDLSQRMTNKSITYCLEFSKLYAPDQLDEADYKRCQADFLTWAVNDARDRLASPLTNIYDSGFSSQTRSLPLPSKVNLLAYIVSQMDPSYLMPSQRLANPLVWAAGAEAYVQMVDQYPKYFDKYPLTGIDRLISTGEDLDAFLGAISVSGNRGKLAANHQLVERLMANYKANGSSLVTAIESMQKDYSEHDARGIKLFEGASQATDYAPTQLSNPIEVSIGGVPSHLPLSPDVRKLLPNSVLNAEKLGLGPIIFTLDFIVVEATIVKAGEIRKQPFYSEYGRLRTTLTVKFKEKLILRRAYDAARDVICNTAGATQYCAPPDLNRRIGELVAGLYTEKENIRDSLPTKSFDLAGADAPTIKKNVDEVATEVNKTISLLRKENASRILTALSRKDALQGRAQMLDGSIDMIVVLPANLDGQGLVF